jgi:purine-binding chemotaxis protein CheW
MSPEDRALATNRAQYCTFHVDHLLVGIDVSHVQEVIRSQPMTPVPLGPAEVEGLINLRGQIVTAIDLRRFLGLAPREEGEASMNAVIRLGEEAISLLVDRPGEVVAPPEEALEQVPRTAGERIRSVFSGTYTLPAGLLLVLEPIVLSSIAGGSRELRRSA